jgi:uncharacterized membrane protein (UPF0127 family)
MHRPCRRGLVFAIIVRLASAASFSGTGCVMGCGETSCGSPIRVVMLFGALVLALCGFGPGGLGAARAAEIQTLEIVTRSGVQVFSVELATTEEEKTTGLMYRKELADGRGMLFDFSPEQQITMWMKNTFISLDMIFIRADGRILRIAENTEPQSTKIIPSGGMARGVLEVIAGTAKKYGIAPGDRVAHPLFNGR